MAIGSATSSSLLNGQLLMQQLRLQEAKRTAEQTQYKADKFREQAADAQKEAVKAQENARSLSVKAQQAQTSAGQANQDVAKLVSFDKTVTQLGQIYTRITASLQGQQSPTPGNPEQTQQTRPSTVVNTQSPTVGAIINTTA